MTRCTHCGGRYVLVSDITAMDGNVVEEQCIACSRPRPRDPDEVEKLLAERNVPPGRQRPTYPRQPQTAIRAGSRFSREQGRLL